MVYNLNSFESVGQSSTWNIDSEVVEKLKNFSLSTVETEGIQLEEGDVKIGVEEGSRSLLGKVFGDKQANFIGVKISLLKLW